MMKKIRLLSVLLIGLLLPGVVVKADEVNKFTSSWDNNNVVDYNILGSSIIGGNDVTVSSSIDGASVIMGNNVTYNASSEYTLLMANNLNFTGSAKDAFMFGNIVTVNANSKITRDLMIFANKVTIAGDFARDVTIYASEVEIDNSQFGGKVKITSDKIDIADNVMISGSLTYNDDANATISQIANLGSSTTFENKIDDEPTLVETIYSHVSNLIGTLIVFTVLFYLIPKLFTGVDKEKKNIVGNMGYGLVYLIVCPVVSVILCLTVFGLGLGLIALVSYLILLFTAIIPTGYLVGNIIWDRFIKKEKAKLVCGYMGITVIYILIVLPYIGNVMLFLTILLGLGMYIRKIKPRSKKEKEITD